jgi:hypothetical protein
MPPGARSSVPAPHTPQPDIVRVALARYVVHEEDDGFGGHGVDLYMGYLMSGAISGGGTTPVMGGLTKNNGGQPRNTHQIQQTLFGVPVPTAGEEGEFAVAKLHLIESDQSTGLIQQAFNSAVVPEFKTVAPPHLTQADLPIFYLVPMGPIIRLLAGSNTDDDYGHWDLIFWSQDGVVGCKAMGGTPECSANPSWCVITPSSKSQIVLSYVDSDNDIDCVIDLSLTYSDSAATNLEQEARKALEAEKKKEEALAAANARDLEGLHNVLKESLKEDNETRKLKLQKLHELNTLNKFMTDQIGRIADASQELAVMEKEGDDSTIAEVSLSWEKPSTDSLDKDGKVIVVERRTKSHTRNSLGTEMKVAENCLKEIRNKNQMAQTAFEQIDKKTNETMNTISRVLRTLSELRQSGAARGGL